MVLFDPVIQVFTLAYFDRLHPAPRAILQAICGVTGNDSLVIGLAPVNGIVTNLSLRPGDYINAGAPVLALVDSDSFYVVGYFEETKLHNIHVRNPASIRLMGDDRILRGHVEGVSAAIDDSSRTIGTNLLPNVNPSFTWVRLAQRVPVRIALDNAPAGLVAGRTATVEIMPER